MSKKVLFGLFASVLFIFTISCGGGKNDGPEKV
jgi:hypothetical protein